MSEFTHCTNCREEVTEDSDFCPHCGILFSNADNVFCETHPQTRATGVCIICQKLVCKECGKATSGRMFCPDHAGVQVQEDWAIAFQSTEINDSELVKSVLEASGFHVHVQNFNSIGFVWDGGGDSPISRKNINKPAKVFVPIPEYLKAVETINEWNSSALAQ